MPNDSKAAAKRILDQIRDQFGWHPAGARREFAELLIAREIDKEHSAAIEEAAQIAEDAADKDGDEDSYDRSGDKLRLAAASIRSLKGKL